MENIVEQLVLQLYAIGAIRFGDFTLKSGARSAFYIDLRLVVSYPELLRAIAALMWQKVQHLQFECLCGVPYTAIPFATALCLSYDLPMLMRRKEPKAYGTKKIIEGVVKPGLCCLVVEDLITSGASIFETIEPLEQEGLKVKDILVLIDREQGGKARLEERGYRLHSVVSISQVFEILQLQGKIDKALTVKNG